MNNKILFIAEYSKENYLLSKQFSNSDDIFFWENEELLKSKMNYFDVINNDEEDNYYILSGGTNSENFIYDISQIIIKSDCDFIITKGLTSSIWPISLVKEQFNINDKYFICILERISDCTDFDINIIKNFDKIIGLGPSCCVDEFSSKTKLLTDNFELSKYVNLEIKEKDITILLDNIDNINILKKEKNLKDLSFIDPILCPENELNILLNISKYVINNLKNIEIDLILSKIGIKKITLNKYLKGNDNNKFELYENGSEINNIKEDFFHYLGKEIYKILKKADNVPMVQGFSFSGD